MDSNSNQDSKHILLTVFQYYFWLVEANNFMTMKLETLEIIEL